MEIRSSTVLPATRTDITLQTADGLSLVGELAVPLDRPPVATLVFLHPLPTAGGYMDSHLIRKASNRLPALAGIATLRFNFRGVSSPRGKSEGSFGEGIDEAHDLAAALRFVQEAGLPQVWLVGWSFGTEVILKHAPEHWG
jgi:Predicted hydrolase of the alpha/beta superfamily